MDGPRGADGAHPYASMAGKLDPKLLKALDVMGFQSMTPVQHRVLTALPDLRKDCLVQAKTGTGKTLAFLLPALHCLLQGTAAAPRGQVAILIITPTRELAQQVATSCDQLTSQLDQPLKCATAVGGTARASAYSRFLKDTPTVLVATPGRLKDYLSDAHAADKLSNIQTLILDEADTMLETGFLADVKEILRLLPHKNTGWQGMCFSATVPPKVRDVVKVVLKPGYSDISTIEKNETPTHERVPQYHMIMPSVGDTFNMTAAIIQHETKNCSKIIVFGPTSYVVAMFGDLFAQGLVNMPVYQIHSRLNQSSRTRTTEQFKNATSGILFASDVVGRGMDFPNVDLVIQIGLPSNTDQYIHRVGRTARAGNDGRAIILFTEPESFFIKAYPFLPIKPHPDTEAIAASVPFHATKVTQIMHGLDETAKDRAYRSYLGFFAGSPWMKRMRLDKPGLVRMANDFAMDAMACPEPPIVEKKTAGKMGLKGVPGLNYGNGSEVRPSTKPRVHRGAVEKNRAEGREQRREGGGGREGREGREGHGRQGGRGHGRGGRGHGRGGRAGGSMDM
ncbi:P-loop containing nucleoside triphosphate hydrolase protein [Aspergillus heteromorphus CBS 117.55]|uniref:ATP-dependent RNA helicase n=1 Tax=Aspergillus heteromorphus CBS 117.55 TaxID=1448321 RepID=A0A317WX96_9EURO|nr:P-loop containing nucleoside triphosphate hydrolase protein [Aspergillus heteromorphus CBS 117.55]PWY89952.1 P-loop containing nucleoside triphosphate hydrolase protein [Aspergillus heteromorphus CBS 117.55]